MLVELHDLIPYLFSISIICTFAYAAYFTHQAVNEGQGREQERFIWVPLIAPAEQVCDREQIHHWLARKIKRKESPDGDSADCSSSFADDYRNRKQRGGFTWGKLMHSLF